MSSNIKANATNTTPSDGSVSSPLKGGAIKAAIVSTRTKSPTSRRNSRFRNHPDNRGRENRSAFCMYVINFGRPRSCSVLPSGLRSNARDNHTVRLPATISRARSMVMISNICVTPPVGSGSAGMAMSMRKKSAKLLSSNSS